MTTTTQNGRLGNQIIRNMAVSLIAQKFDLKVNYCNKELIENLGIELFSGSKVHNGTMILTDDNYFEVYNGNNLKHNLNPNQNYFQTKQITNFLYDYLHKDEIKNNIIQKNNLYKDRYNNNNDLFVHVRLGDAIHWNPGVPYYVNTIKNIQFDNLYISSDSPHHDIMQKILKQYPTATIINYDEVKTIQFASTCKNILLSHGSFSAVIGYLSFFSNIYYPEYENDKIWYGDMFSIPSWNKCPVKQIYF